MKPGWRNLVVLLAALVASCAGALAGENRFLLVVETTADSARNIQATRDAVADLLVKGFNGIARPGDTVGLWTAGEKVDISFPRLVWQPGAARSFALEADKILSKRPWTGRLHWTNALPALNAVAANSEALTVILVTAPRSRFAGLPFSENVSAVQDTAAADLERTKLPFVTFLTVRGRMFTAAAVNSGLGPWTIPNPPLPKPVVAQVPPSKSVASIVPKVESKPAPAIKPPELKPAPPVVVVTVPETKPEPPVRAETKRVETAPPVAPPIQVANEPAKSETPKPSPTALPAVPAPIVVESKPAPVLAAKADPAHTPSRPRVEPATATASVESGTAAKDPVNLPKQSSWSLTVAPPGDGVARAGAVENGQAFVGTVALPVAGQASKEDTQQSPKKTSAHPAPALAPAVAAVNPPGGGRGFLLAGGGLVIGIALLGWLAFRRPKAQQGSLITESLRAK